MRMSSRASRPTNVIDWASVGLKRGTGIALLWWTLCHDSTFTLKKLLHSMSTLKPITLHSSSYNTYCSFIMWYHISEKRHTLTIHNVLIISSLAILVRLHSTNRGIVYLSFCSLKHMMNTHSNVHFLNFWETIGELLMIQSVRTCLFISNELKDSFDVPRICF